ncbi:MAG: UDP-N-acetylmuramoyl-tripeptide--D-alanyl-D-alanine ligase [Candidatus Paceibacterota bacterium]
MKQTFKKIILNILKIEAQLVIKKYKPKIITITGSLGKTSTKDAIYAVLSDVYHVRMSEKSYNSQIGLPLTILGLPNGWNDPMVWILNILKGLKLIIFKTKYPEYLVLEVGVGKPGDMKETAMWLQSDVVVMTAIGDVPAHVEFFKSREHLIEEKSGLIKTLKKEGTLVLNTDDADILAMKTKTKSRITTYGFNERADLVCSNENIFYIHPDHDNQEKNKELNIEKILKETIPEGITFRVDVEGASFPVIIEGVFGKNHIYASLASLAVAHSLKLSLLESINALKNYEVPAGRMRLLLGENNTIIIDDTYNSSPFAVESALKTLSSIDSSPRKIAVLGDMLELGRHTEEAHNHIGKIAKETIDILVVVGPRAQSIKTGALASGMKEENIFEFPTAILAGEFLKTFIKRGDIILIKGSQGVRMERTVEKILKDKHKKEKLLVRQEKEWIDKE